MNVESKYVWHQGKIVPFEEATIHFLNSSFHYGTGVFEGIRAYKAKNGTAIFRLKDHVDRLFESLLLLGVDQAPYSKDVIFNSCKDIVKKNELDECYIRPMFYVREGGWGLTLKDALWDYSVAAWPWDKYHGETAKHKGIKAKVSSFNRNHINVSLTKGKISGNYVNSVLAKLEAKQCHVDESILLDRNGFVAECTGQNIFIIKNGKVKTPMPYLILEGFTRDTVIQFIKSNKMKFEECLITRDQLYLADEIFIVGTANEILPVVEVDGRRIGCGRPGAMTLEIQGFYDLVVRGEVEDFSDYLDWV